MNEKIVKTQTESSGGDDIGNSSNIAIGTFDDEKPIKIAQDQARKLGHNFVSTELILYGLINYRNGYAHSMLKELGLPKESICDEIINHLGRGAGHVANEIPFTPRVKQVLRISWVTAMDFESKVINSAHLLIALLKYKHSYVNNLLIQHGITLEDLEDQYSKMLERDK